MKRTLSLVLATAWRAAPAAMLIGLVLHPLGFAIRALDGVWIKLITDAVVAGDLQAATWSVVGATAAVAVGSVALGAGARNRSTIEEQVSFEVERMLADATASLPGLEQHERPEYVARIETIRQGQRQIGNIAKDVGYTGATFIRLVLSSLLLATVLPILALVPLAGLPMVWAASRANGRRRPMEEQIGTEYLLARQLFSLSRTAASAKEIRVLGLQGALADRMDQSWDVVRHAYVRVAGRDALETLGAVLFANLAYAAAVILAVRAAADGQATAGDVVMVALVGQQVTGALGRVIGGMLGIATQLRVGERLLWVLDLASATPESSEGAFDGNAGIQIDDVTFRYPGTDVDVLHDVRLDLRPGTVVALVGENGAGKTSLVKLLCGFYTPSDGTITANGVPLVDGAVSAWREHMTAGFQDFARLEVPLGESVGVGDLDHTGRDERAAWALDRAGGQNIATRSPNGLATMLGRQWDGGSDLSGGEWQKVANGRALMRERPLLRIFDEPTSALDPVSEQAMFDQLSEATRQQGQGSITLFVSHRFSTVRGADEIVVLDRGRIVQRGSHEELMREGGLYADLFAIQAAAYDDSSSTE